MSKYIDAEKLEAIIIKWRSDLISLMNEIYYAANYNEWKAELDGYNKILFLIASLHREQPEVDYNKFEKLFNDFCERNKGHHITTHDACMWFWELGLNAKKEE